MDTDIRLLLAVQYVCNKQGVKIPWKEVAETMGPKFTEGAVVQHLSKLRTKREEQDKPNPPPLKRAGNGSSKKDANHKKEVLHTHKEAVKPPTQTGKRRRLETPSEYTTDDMPPMKKKHAQSKKKNEILVAPRLLRKKPEHFNSDGSRKALCLDAPWLNDFKGGYDEQGDDKKSKTSEEHLTGNSTETSQATTQDSKKSKIVKLKVDAERLASVDAEIHAATSRHLVASNNPPHALELHQSPRYPYMHSDPVNVFSSFPQSTYPGTNNMGPSVPYPSSGPSPFNVVDPSHTSDTDAKDEDVPDTAPQFDDYSYDSVAGYPQYDMPSQFENQGLYGGYMIPSSSYSDTQFMHQDNPLYVHPSEFRHLPVVDRPRYLGYQGESTKEF